MWQLSLPVGSTPFKRIDKELGASFEIVAVIVICGLEPESPFAESSFHVPSKVVLSCAEETLTNNEKISANANGLFMEVSPYPELRASFS